MYRWSVASRDILHGEDAMHYPPHGEDAMRHLLPIREKKEEPKQL